MKPFWANRNPETEKPVRELLTRKRPSSSTPTGKDVSRISPDSYTMDQLFLDRPGNDAIQLNLLHNYQSNLALYEGWHQFFRIKQPKTLIVWGKNDPFFTVEGGPVPDAQVLVYPNTDLTLSQPSVSEKGTGWGLLADDVAWGAGQWVPDAAQRADPTVSPLHATDLTGLPPALVITAEHDPLRDEGEAYAARLAAAGVPTTYRREQRMIHGFLTLDTVSPAAAAAGNRLFADIARMLPDIPAGGAR